jgi:hypothetical protein
MQRPVPQLRTATNESSIQGVALVVAVAVAVSIQAVALLVVAVAVVAVVVSIEANPSLAIPQQQIGSALKVETHHVV